MVLVFGLAALLWGIGALMGAPKAARFIMIGLLYVGVLSLHIALPEGHPLRMATGESGAFWLIFGGVAVLAYAYSAVLDRLRSRARKIEEAQPLVDAPPLSDTELNRYARHIVLREVGGMGQRALKEAKVLVIGAGGLGSPALQYLTAAGVGTIGVIDDDFVDNTNLQRQVIHVDENIGMSKVFSAQAAMEAQNPFVTVRPYDRRLTEDIAADLFADYDLVLDGSDSFATRDLVNRTCVALGLPLISAAITQWEGQISLFDPARGAPCYACVFPNEPADGLAPSCAEAGVIGPLPGVLGSMMAVEAIKQITGAGETLTGAMLIYDGLYGETRRIAVTRNSDCPVCSQTGETHDKSAAE